MIFTDRTITVRKGKSQMDEPIVVYRGDYELEVRFTILNSRFKFISGANMIESEKASYGQLAILTPYGGNIFSDIVKCNDGSVTFVLTAEMLNQIEEVGLYSFQIRLMDYNKESRVSIPPIEYGIEVREPIASEDHDNSVNNAIVGYSIAKVVDPKEENVGDTFNESGNYNKTKWETGDRISQGKLNKIEDAIDKVNKNEMNNSASLSKRIDNNFNVLDSVKADKNEIFSMANMGQDIKEAMTGGSVAVVGRNTVTDDNVVDNSISREKLNFYSTIGNNNLADKNNFMINKTYNSSGTLVEGYSNTGFIPVTPGLVYHCFNQNYRTAWYCYWNNKKEYISGGELLEQFSPIGGASYITITIYNDCVDKYYVTLYPNNPYGKKVCDEELNITDDNIQDKTISRDKLNFLTKHTFNLADPDNYIIGHTYNDKGEYISGYNNTGFISVKPNTKYVFDSKRGAWCCYWDKNKNFISGLIGEGVLNTPSNCYYITVLIYDDQLNTMYVCEEQYKDMIDVLYYTDDLLKMPVNSILGEISSEHIQDKTISRDKLNFLTKHTFNLADPDNYIIGHTYNDKGEYISGYNNTGFISVKPNTKYVFDSKRGAWCCYWDKNKNFISGLIGEGVLNTPSNCYYITVLIYDDQLNTMYVCEEQYKDMIDVLYYTDDLLKMPVNSILGEISSEHIQDNAITAHKLQANSVDPTRVTFINTERTNNLYNKNDKITNGYYDVDGTWRPGGEYYSSSFIPVEPNTTYAFKSFSGQGAGWAKTYWDADKRVINAPKQWASIFTTPDGCYYVTVTTDLPGVEQAMLVQGNTTTSVYEPYYTYVLAEEIDIPSSASNNKLKNKKWNAMGDSITNGYGYLAYHHWIAQECGVLVRNYGISGNRLSTDGGSYGVPMCIRYADMDDDADIITVMGGTNDQAHGVPLGVFSDRTVDTFYGGLHVLIQGLIAKYPGKTIAFLTPIQRSGCKDNNGFKDGGLIKYVDAIIEVCEYYSIPCLDLFRHGGIQHDIESVASVYIKDGTHPTNEGHRDILAGKIRGFLESLL